MSKLVKQTENELKIIIENAVNKAMASGDLPQAEIPQFNIEKPAFVMPRRITLYLL